MPSNSSKKYQAQLENIGDFYVTRDECITCGAPEAEAPDIIEHSKKDEYGQCFFKKQPESEAELDQAIKAMMISCISALRYGGRDEKIIRRLYENDMSELCDNPPNEHIDIIIRDKVTFHFDDGIKELSKLFSTQYNSLTPYFRFEHYLSKKSKKIDIIRSITNSIYKTRFSCLLIENNFYELTIELQNKDEKNDIIGWAMHLHDFIRKHAQKISWYSFKDNYEKKYTKPY